MITSLLFKLGMKLIGMAIGLKIAAVVIVALLVIGAVILI